MRLWERTIFGMVLLSRFWLLKILLLNFLFWFGLGSSCMVLVFLVWVLLWCWFMLKVVVLLIV